MKKRLFALIVPLVCAATLTAEVLPISNFKLGDAPRFIPRVREYLPYEGALKLPERFTVQVQDGEELIVEQLAEALRHLPGIKVERNTGDGKAFCRFWLIPDPKKTKFAAACVEFNPPAHPQGYRITVGGNGGIIVSSRTTDGLFYGAQTLRNLLSNLTAPELRKCLIEDLPDLDRRGYFVTINSMSPKHLPALKRTIDAMASLKMNWLLLEVGESFPYRDNPFTLRKNSFTAEELRDLLKFCRKRHIRVTPTLQVWSHAAWLTRHPRWKEMSEGNPNHPWNCIPCTASDEAIRVTEAALIEQMEFFRSPDFFMMMDEFYLAPFQSCDRCRGKDLYQQYRKIVKRFEQLALQRGVKPIICHDSFLDYPQHKWKIGNKLRGDLDPRSEILWWDYADRLKENTLAPFRNFTLIGHSIICKPSNTFDMVRLIKKYGGSASTLVYWYDSAAKGVLGRLHETAANLGGFVIGADYLWKYPDVEYPRLGYDATFEMMRRLFPERPEHAPAAEPAAPVPLEDQFNAELSHGGAFPRLTDADLAELNTVLAGEPERFHIAGAPGGRYYGMRVAGHKSDSRDRIGIRVPLGDRKIRELSFLLTATRPDDMRAYAGGAFRGKKRFGQPVVATLHIGYADGGTREVPLKFRRDINHWNSLFGGIGMRWAVRGTDADGHWYDFGVYTFRNPEPERPIRSIGIGSKRTEGISPVILAVSARGVDKPFGLPGKVDPAAVAARGGVSDKASAKFRIAADFEHGMGDVIVVGSKLLEGKFKTEIVNDPGSPSRSKVLKITVPAGNYKGHDRDHGFVRIDINLPYTVAPGATGLTIDHKLVFNGRGFHHANNYFVDRVSRRANPQARFRADKLCVGGGWQREIIPFGAERSNREMPLDDLSQTKMRKVSFFFNEIDAPVEIFIDNIGDSMSQLSTMPYWNAADKVSPMF